MLYCCLHPQTHLLPTLTTPEASATTHASRSTYPTKVSASMLIVLCALHYMHEDNTLQVEVHISF